MKKSTKCVFLYVREELAKNFTQTKNSKKCWVKCFQSGQRAGGRGGGPEIEEFFANEEIEEMRCSPRPRRTRKEFHASEEMEEMLGHMFPRWPKRAGVRGVKKSENSSQLKKSKKCFVLHVLGELPKNSTQTRNRRNVELYVPKLAQRPELGIRLGVLSFQYKHWWDFSYKSFTGCKIVKQCGFCYLRLRSNTYQKLFIL